MFQPLRGLFSMTFSPNDPELLPFEYAEPTPWPPSDEDIDELQRLWDEHLQSVPTPEERNSRLS